MDIMKLLAYVPLLTPRIKYIFNFIFLDILKTEVEFCSNLAEFKSSSLPKISYCNQPIADELHFKNADLLLSHEIVRTTFKTTAFGDTIVPFAVNGGAVPFDIFAAAFYFVSRYEEYMPFNADDEGHYPAELSLQSRLKLLQIPVVDAWAMILKNLLLKKYPKLLFAGKRFEFIPLSCMYPEGTNPPGLMVTLSSLFKKVKARIYKKPLPESHSAEIHQFLKTLQDKYHLKGLFFYQPSQHPDLPNSYLKLIKEGTMNDYHMGYEKTPGFRAGTCTPFLWYDLQLEKTTQLLVHPIAINDLCLSPDKIMRPAYLLAEWENMISTVKMLDGTFYMTWHQNTLINMGKGKFARKLYEEMLRNFLSLPYDVRPQ